MLAAINAEAAAANQTGSPKSPKKAHEPQIKVNLAHKDAVLAQLIGLSRLHADSCEMINDLASAVMSYEKILQVLTLVTLPGKSAPEMDGVLKKLIVVLKQAGRHRDADKYVRQLKSISEMKNDGKNKEK